MLEAAKQIPYASQKSTALKKVVTTALEQKDFDTALRATREDPYVSSQTELLLSIVDAALQSRSTIGYAVLAAEKIQYSSQKTQALQKIIDGYAALAKQQSPSGSLLFKGEHGASASEATKK